MLTKNESDNPAPSQLFFPEQHSSFYKNTITPEGRIFFAGEHARFLIPGCGLL